MSPFGLIGNLAGDVKDAALGIPAGLYETGKALALDEADVIRSGGKDTDYERTAKIGKAIGKSYTQTYGPLVRGDIDTFLGELYEHPLGPILDVATVATLGGAGAAKAGQLAGKVGVVSKESKFANLAKPESIQLRSPRAIVEGEGPVVSGRPLSRNPVIRGRQKLVDTTLKALPAKTPGVGEIARYGKELERGPRREALRLRHQSARYQRVAEKLTTEETAALHLIARGVHPDDYRLLLEREGRGSESMAKVLSNAKVRELVEHPTTKLRAAHREAKALSEVMAAVKTERGLLDPEGAASRVGLHREIVREEAGPERTVERGRTSDEAQAEFARLDAELRKQLRPFVDTITSPESRRSEQALRNVRPRGKRAQSAVSVRLELEGIGSGRSVLDDAQEMAEGRIVELAAQQGADPRIVALAQKIERRDDMRSRVGEAAFSGEGDLGRVAETVRDEFPVRDLPLAPFYMPDTPAEMRIASLGKSGGGVGVPRKLGSAKRNAGVLFRTGALEITKDALTPEWFAMVKFGLHSDLHDLLLESAVRLPKGSPLPKGYIFLRRSARERIGPVERTAGERERSLTEILPEGEESILSEGFGTRNAADAAEQGGYRMIVPEAMAKQVAGEFLRGGKILRGFLGLTSVWRAIVLGTRPAFLVNNLVGNALLYAIHNAGPTGMRAYLNAVRTAKGPQAVEKLLRDPKTRDVITPEWIEDVFPEQAQAATFGATQGAIGSIRNPGLRRGARAAGAGIIPATQAIAEGTFRRAGVEAALRRSPEVKATAKRMEDQTARLEDVARRAIEENPDLQRRISQEVNDMLGDYLSMGSFERTYLRSLFPFVAWYKAIAGITARLVLDHPGRANVLANLGRVGQELNPQWAEMPSYLEGSIALGEPEGDLQPILTTQAVNPFATIPTLARAGGAALAGKPGDLGHAFDDLGNPLLTALLEQATGRSMYSGAPVSGTAGPVVGALRSVGEGLPPYRVVTAGPTRLYPQRSLLSEALAASGAPVKRVSLAEARRRAREGR